MHTVGAVLVTEWYDNPNVTAIIWAGLPGQETGNAITDVLYGKYTPSGKLPFTMGASRSDYSADVLYTPNNGGGPPQQDFSEGVFIDYRGFDSKNITPIYEFGFGLSYTTFSYSNLQVSKLSAPAYVPASGMTTAAPTYGNSSLNPASYLLPSNLTLVPTYIYPYINSTDLRSSSNDSNYGEANSSYIPANAQDGSPQPILPAGGGQGGNPGLYDALYSVTASVTNTGSIPAYEVPQLYVSLGGDEPPVVLRGFDKLFIGPGASVEFNVQLTRRDVSEWDVASQNWIVTNNTKTVYVGSSSRKLPLSAVLS